MGNSLSTTSPLHIIRSTKIRLSIFVSFLRFFFFFFSNVLKLLEARHLGNNRRRIGMHIHVIVEGFAQLELNSHDNIDHVKAKLQDQTGIAPGQQCLFYGGTRLDRTDTLIRPLVHVRRTLQLGEFLSNIAEPPKE
jgi:hypothetical protein